eukprot:TRINITY_DN45192_c0_g1_i1.p1 TRINITY_DN45192_c0_g1~~TRINITY_DN45192_c0_g1_i1.p1  ORF type:complete len:714 (-),score=105.36 TRINITY_DN45192_c0_g1_i1:125-2266(-)
MDAVAFKVRCEATKPGDCLRVVGSTAELGNWDPAASTVTLQTSGDSFPVWVSGGVQVDAPLEYKYVILRTGLEPRWESCPNRQLSSSSHGQMDCVTDTFDTVHESPPSSPSASGYFVSFQVECPNVGPEQHLRVVGSIEELGAWSPVKSLARMSRSDDESSVWRSLRIDLQQPQPSFEYKYVLCSDTQAPSWENRPNRQVLSTHYQKVHLIAKDCFDSPENGSITAKHVVTADTAPQETSIEGRAAPNPSQEGETVEQVELVKAERSPKRHATTPLIVTRRSSLVSRSKTVPSPSELPKTLLDMATRRCIDGNERQRQGWKGFAREAACHELQALKLAPAPVQVESSEQGSTVAISKAAFERFRCLTKKLDADDEETSDAGSTALTDPSDVEDIVLTDCRTESDEKSELERPAQKESAHASTFDEAYELGEQLGEGAFGVVYKCTSKLTHEEFARKVVMKSRLNPKDYALIFGDSDTSRDGEMLIHQSLPRHPNVVGMHMHFEDASTLNMILDFCPGGDLFDEILRAHEADEGIRLTPAFSEAKAGLVIGQVLRGLCFCHSRGIVHRDVKAENVLLTQAPVDLPGALVRLCDFGLAARCSVEDGDILTEVVGSPDYVAPEVVRRLPYGQKVDVWSAGVLMFVCMVCYSPFAADTDAQVLRNVAKGSFEFNSDWDVMSGDVQEHIARLLELDPISRPTAALILDEPFFGEHFGT